MAGIPVETIGENIVHKVCHKYWSAFFVYVYILDRFEIFLLVTTYKFLARFWLYDAYSCIRRLQRQGSEKSKIFQNLGILNHVEWPKTIQPRSNSADFKHIFR